MVEEASINNRSTTSEDAQYQGVCWRVQIQSLLDLFEDLVRPIEDGAGSTSLSIAVTCVILPLIFGFCSFFLSFFRFIHSFIRSLTRHYATLTVGF